MKIVNLEALPLVSRSLAALNQRVVFTGGSIIPLLVDTPDVLDIRPTKDVDVLLEVLTLVQYQDLNQRLPELGYRHDTSDEAPRCRWLLDDLTVDIMPAQPITGELNARWFQLAMQLAEKTEIGSTQLLVVNAPCFIATKMDAFAGRGKNDFMMSHDFEDIITVIDNRAGLFAEVKSSPPELQQYIAETMHTYLTDSTCMDNLPGHLPSDTASQERLPDLINKMKALADLV